LEDLPYSSLNRRDENRSVMALTGMGLPSPRANPSLDHLVGAGEERRWYVDAYGAGGL
jgi:hypothetical protein